MTANASRYIWARRTSGSFVAEYDTAFCPAFGIPLSENQDRKPWETTAKTTVFRHAQFGAVVTALLTASSGLFTIERGGVPVNLENRLLRSPKGLERPPKLLANSHGKPIVRSESLAVAFRLSMRVMLRIVIADGQCLVRSGLKTLIEKSGVADVTGEACDGVSAVELAEKKKPDILVTELALPRLHGLEVIRRVNGHTKAVVVTVDSEGPQVTEALRAGASGYLVKDDTPEDLLEALKQVAAGNHYISPRLKKSAIKAALGNRSLDPDPFNDLTLREREVLEHAAQGLCNREIGTKLCISSRTVESHRGNVMKKLGLRNQTDLVRYAIRRRLITA